MFQQNEMTNMVMKANETFMASVMNVSAVAMEAQEQMAKRQLAISEKALAAGNRQFDLLEDVKDAGDFVTKSSELAAGFGQDMVAVMQETMEMQAELAGKFMAAMNADPVARAKPVKKAAAKRA